MAQCRWFLIGTVWIAGCADETSLETSEQGTSLAQDSSSSDAVSSGDAGSSSQSLSSNDQSNSSGVGGSTQAEFALETGQLASYVITSDDFDSSGYLNALGDGLLFRFPGGLASDGSNLVLTDKHNNRVLLWESVSAAITGASPDIVLGQPDASQNDSGNGLDSMNWPAAVSTAQNRLVVADTFNNRVLVWDSLPTIGEDGKEATCAIDVDTNPNIEKLQAPWGVWTDGNRLLVSDTFGNSSQVYVWNNFWSGGSADCAAAPDFTLTGIDPENADAQMTAPRGISSDGTRLFISETNRKNVDVSESRGMFVWNTFPTSDAAFDDYLLSSETGAGAPVSPPVSFEDETMSLTQYPARQIEVWCDTPSSTETPNFVIELPSNTSGLSDGSGMIVTNVANGMLLLSPSSSNVVIGYNLPLYARYGASACSQVNASSSGCSAGSDGGVVCDGTYDAIIGEADSRISRNMISHPSPQIANDRVLVFSAYDLTLHGYEAGPSSSHPDPEFQCEYNQKDNNINIGFHSAKNKFYGDRYTIVGSSGLMHWATAPSSADDCKSYTTFSVEDLGLGSTSSLEDIAWTNASGLGEGLFIADTTEGEQFIHFYPKTEIESLESGQSAVPSCDFSVGMANGRLTLAANDSRLVVNVQDDVLVYDITETECPSSTMGSLSTNQPSDYQVQFSLSIALTDDGKLFVPDAHWTVNRVMYWSTVEDLINGSAPSAILGTSDGAPDFAAVSQSRLTLPGYVAFDEQSAQLWLGEHDWGSRLLVFNGI